MCQLAVVVLNYMNFQETEQCVDSVLSQNLKGYKIIIVDNGSVNDSYFYLKKRYKKSKDVIIIRTNKNYGFAKGNNIGIHYAKVRFAADFVLLLNSDTVLEDVEYLSKMLQAYEKGVGVIGSRIILRDGREERRLMGYITFPSSLFDYFQCLCGRFLFYDLAEKMKNMAQKKQVEILRGCDLLLTPDYFRIYEGLYEKTFLYYEEELLYIRCQRAGLKEKSICDTYIIHKEGQSSKDIHKDKRKFYKFALQSKKYVLKESLLDYMKDWLNKREKCGTEK